MSQYTGVEDTRNKLEQRTLSPENAYSGALVTVADRLRTTANDKNFENPKVFDFMSRSQMDNGIVHDTATISTGQGMSGEGEIILVECKLDPSYNYPKKMRRAMLRISGADWLVITDTGEGQIDTYIVHTMDTRRLTYAKRSSNNGFGFDQHPPVNFAGQTAIKLELQGPVQAGSTVVNTATSLIDKLRDNTNETTSTVPEIFFDRLHELILRQPLPATQPWYNR